MERREFLKCAGTCAGLCGATVLSGGVVGTAQAAGMTGVAALKVSNRRGSFTILPWMGQMIWR